MKWLFLYPFAFLALCTPEIQLGPLRANYLQLRQPLAIDTSCTTSFTEASPRGTSLTANLLVQHLLPVQKAGSCPEH